MSPFCGATDTLFWTSGDVSSGFKARVGSLIWAAQRHMCYTFPEIHLWCDTYQPLGGQHGSWTVSSMYLWGIGGTRNWELSCHRSQCEIRQTLYRLSYPGLIITSFYYCTSYSYFTHKLTKKSIHRFLSNFWGKMQKQPLRWLPTCHELWHLWNTLQRKRYYSTLWRLTFWIAQIPFAFEFESLQSAEWQFGDCLSLNYKICRNLPNGNLHNAGTSNDSDKCHSIKRFWQDFN